MALNLNLTLKPLKMRGMLICFLVGCTCLPLQQEIARGKKGPVEGAHLWNTLFLLMKWPKISGAWAEHVASRIKSELLSLLPKAPHFGLS